MDLKSLQQQFIANIYNKDNNKIYDIVKNDQIPANQHMQIYRNNTFLSVTSILKNIYPTICRLVDERFFTYACNEYIKNHPSKSGNLDDYGHDFGTFLQNFPPTKDMLYLHDIAQIEWILHHTNYLPEGEYFSLQDLLSNKNASWQNYMSLYKSNFALDKVFDLNDDQNQEQIDINSNPCYIFITRKSFKTTMYFITQEEYYKLDSIRPNSQALEIHP